MTFKILEIDKNKAYPDFYTIICPNKLFHESLINLCESNLPFRKLLETIGSGRWKITLKIPDYLNILDKSYSCIFFDNKKFYRLADRVIDTGNIMDDIILSKNILELFDPITKSLRIDFDPYTELSINEIGITVSINSGKVSLSIDRSFTIGQVIDILGYDKEIYQLNLYGICLENGNTLDYYEICNNSIFYVVKVSSPTSKIYYIKSSDTNYCSTKVPDQNVQSDSPISITKINFIKKTLDVYHHESIVLYHHPDCPITQIETIFLAETNNDFFDDLEILREMEPLIKLFSRDALLRYVTKLLEFKKKEDKSVQKSCGCSKEIFNQNNIDRALALEEKIRLSTGIQLEFNKAEGSFDRDWLDVVTKIQLDISQKFTKYSITKCNSCVQKFLGLMRTTTSSIVPHWRKYNRASKGYFYVDTPVTDCVLYSSGNYRSLRDFTRSGIHVIISGSIS